MVAMTQVAWIRHHRKPVGDGIFNCMEIHVWTSVRWHKVTTSTSESILGKFEHFWGARSLCGWGPSCTNLRTLLNHQNQHVASYSLLPGKHVRQKVPLFRSLWMTDEAKLLTGLVPPPWQRRPLTANRWQPWGFFLAACGESKIKCTDCHTAQAL